MDPLIKKSKRLSKVLRHDPSSVGLKLDAAGWTPVLTLLPAMHLTMEELEQVVADNNKKRFEFNEDKSLIRASQGHSVEVELGYEEKTPPSLLFHGTSTQNFGAIFSEKNGLLKMGRHQVHLSADEATALVVARRRPQPVILHVAAGRMAQQGLKFYLSTNGVWLTECVPVQFLTRP